MVSELRGRERLFSVRFGLNNSCLPLLMKRTKLGYSKFSPGTSAAPMMALWVAALIRPWHCSRRRLRPQRRWQWRHRLSLA
ncbi:hypothetical protein CRG98_004617 [Punica granatum]|uniref:Uncharacterized protein n=1 Tax=Punica granatum TaxID=22663 RepID=A0A2I0L2E0_PUNGR|nr:hypothetical protein CRG98_004617 [Punica granatum]